MRIEKKGETEVTLKPVGVFQTADLLGLSHYFTESGHKMVNIEWRIRVTNVRGHKRQTGE